jgi:DNA polymerase-3 subunit epsilon
LPPDETDSAALAYTALLDRVLEDRRVEEIEAQALLELATTWGLSGDLIKQLHRNYLLRLGAAALSDFVLTDVERRDLRQVAELLGIESRNLDAMLESAHQMLGDVIIGQPESTRDRSAEDLLGRRVCFTGECQCSLNGCLISREKASELASAHGMIVVETVTKKLDLLVVADPYSQSGKAKKARAYGIRVMHEPVFWRTIGVEVD